jgi:hypothetical protein
LKFSEPLRFSMRMIGVPDSAQVAELKTYPLVSVAKYLSGTTVHELGGEAPYGRSVGAVTL